MNLLLHCTSAVLLWRILRRLGLAGDGTEGTRSGLSFAWVAAAAFALHPVQVESVAWISERKNVLSGLFLMLATLAHARFDPITERPGGGRDWRWYAVAVGCFASALLSKTVAATWPAAMLVLVWWRRGKIRLADALPMAPLLLLGAGMGLHTAHLEVHQVGATGASFELSGAQRCLIAGRTPWFYAGKLLWPAQQSFIYPRWTVDPERAWQWAFPLATVATLGALWRFRRRIGRGPLAAVLCFGGTLFPALGFFDVYPFRYSFVADHFQYLACVPLIVLVLAAARRLLARGGRATLVPAAVAAAVLVAGLVALTVQRAEAFTSSLALWRDVVQKDPDSRIGNEHLANSLAAIGDTAGALEHFAKAIKRHPDYAEYYNDRGVLLVRLERHLEALADFNRAIELDPELVVAYKNRGNLLLALQMLPQAMADLERARSLVGRD